MFWGVAPVSVFRCFLGSVFVRCWSRFSCSGSAAEKGAHTDSPTKTNDILMFFKVHSAAGAATRKPNSTRKCIKNKHSTSKKNNVFFHFTLFFCSPRRVTEKNQKIPPRSPPRALRRPPGRLKPINFSPQEAPRRRPMIFFGPRRSQRSGRSGQVKSSEK